MHRSSKRSGPDVHGEGLAGANSILRQRFRGCLLGGAVGDALGAPVEFMTRAQILARYGEHGIQSFDAAYGRKGAITDDTQMTMFTAEGLLQAVSRRRSGIVERPELVVHRAYLRWLATQELVSLAYSSGAERSGWLITLPELRARRAPGSTCLSALASGRVGTADERLNNSKGCGGVMRVAPCALVKEWDPFELGCKVAALTHGHPSGYLAAGVLALIIRCVLEDVNLSEAIERAVARLEKEPGHEESVTALEQAVALWDRDAREGDVEQLGAGWVAEEALAIGVYGALAGEESFATGIQLAANHSGDSDSTAAIAGNILGALYGEDEVLANGYRGVELREEIVRLADDLFAAWQDESGWTTRYPAKGATAG